VTPNNRQCPSTDVYIRHNPAWEKQAKELHFYSFLFNCFLFLLTVTMCTILLLLHYYIHFTAFFPGQPGLEGTRNVNHSGFYWSKKRWGGSGISWTMCKSIAPRSRQITTPAPHHSVFTARIPFLPPNQQCQSTEAITLYTCEHVYKTQLSKRATSHF